MWGACIIPVALVSLACHDLLGAANSDDVIRQMCNGQHPLTAAKASSLSAVSMVVHVCTSSHAFTE